MGKNSKIPALPKKIGWPILIALVFLDAAITYSRGREGNPLWKPLVEAFGTNMLFVLAALVLVLFYAVVRFVGWYITKKEHFPQGEGIVLTTFVIAFATYDFYIIFLLPYIGFLGTNSHYAVIPVLLVPVLAYNVWADRNRKK